MTPCAFHRACAASLPTERTFYHRLKRLAAAGTLPDGVATPKDGGWAFDLPNPAREPEQVEVIIDLIKQAARPRGKRNGKTERTTSEYRFEVYHVTWGMQVSESFSAGYSTYEEAREHAIKANRDFKYTLCSAEILDTETGKRYAGSKI